MTTMPFAAARLTPKLDHLTNGEHHWVLLFEQQPNMPRSNHRLYIPIQGDAHQSITHYIYIYWDLYSHGMGWMTVFAIHIHKRPI